MLEEIKTNLEHFFVDEHCRRQGEYKLWSTKGDLIKYCNYLDGLFHGEFKTWWENGTVMSHFFCDYNSIHGEFKENDVDGYVIRHCFYFHGKEVSLAEIPYPNTPEDLTYFKLKYDLPLLPVEQPC